MHRQSNWSTGVKMTIIIPSKDSPEYKQGRKDERKRITKIIEELPTTYNKNYKTGIQNTTIEVQELLNKINEKQ